MSTILTAKPWHIFIAVTLLPAGVFWLVVSFLPKPMLSITVPILFLPWYAWLYIVGTNLYKITGRFPSRSIVYFKITIFITIFAWILACFTPGEEFTFEDNRGLFTITLLFIFLGTFFSLMQIAKALTAAQGHPTDSYKDYGGNFLTLWWFPFSSFWFLQKETRKIFLEKYIQ